MPVHLRRRVGWSRAAGDAWTSKPWRRSGSRAWRPMNPLAPVTSTRRRSVMRRRDRRRRAATVAPAGGRIGPADHEGGIVPAHAVGGLGDVPRVHRVEHLGLVGERLQPVREARADEQRAPVLGAQLGCEPAVARGRVRPQTATSEIAPRVQRTCFDSPCGATW